MRPSLALLLSALAALAACGRGPEPVRRPPPTPLRDQMTAVDPQKTVAGTLTVAGMTCTGCEYNVRSALQLVDGVLEAEADRASGQVRVRYDPERTTLAHLAEAVRTTGYDAAPGGADARAERGE